MIISPPFSPVKGTIVAGIVLASVASISAKAQETTKNPAASRGIDTVMVTAQKRAEPMQDVPIAVTAIGGDQLEKQRVIRMEDITTVTPNLQVTDSIGDGVPIFSLRGVTMSDFSLNQASPVATYFDEVYRGNFALLGIAMFDIDRVEVLRGPQGTLYGKNTTGGAVNIFSRKPSFDLNGYLQLGYGNYNMFEANGAVNIPMTDKVAARLAFTLQRRDGWMENIFPGGKDANAIRQYGVRASILFEPNDNFNFLLRANTSLQNPINYGNPGVPLEDGIGAGVYELFGSGSSYFSPPGRTRTNIDTPDTARRHARTYAISGIATWNVTDVLTLTSVTSWDQGSFDTLEDSDGSPLKTAIVRYAAKTRQFSQDLRLTSSFDGPFNFLVGAYYNKERVYNLNATGLWMDLDTNGDGAVDHTDCLFNTYACNNQNHFSQIKDSAAAYADASYAITSKLTARAGLRFSYDRGKLRDFIAQSIGADGIVVSNNIPGDPTDLDATTSRDLETTNISGKAGLDYKLWDEGLVYFSYSRGYRGGAFSAQAYASPSELTIAKPEIVDSFEAGLKSQFLDDRLRINAAAFWYGYKNQQFINIDPELFIQPLVNLPKSRIFGGELEIVAKPVDELSVSLALGFLDSSVREGTLQGVDLKGNRLANAPTLSLSGAIDWTVATGNWGTLALHVDGSYQTKQFYDVFERERTSQKGYGLLNARVDLTSSDETWIVAGWVKNLTNTFYATARLESSALGFMYLHLGAPRTYGISIERRF